MIRLHHVPQARSFRILWLLEELGLPFEVAEHSFFDKSLRTPDYLALSPAGRVPALEIDGRRLFESGAITQYLCEREGALLGAPAERADWLEWLHFAETIAVHVANLTQQHIVLREDWMRSPTVMRLEAARLAKTLEVVERGLAGDHLLPSGFSAVDIAVSYGAMIGQRFVSLDPLPGLRDWLARLSDRPAFARAVVRDGVAQIYTRDFYPAPEG
ncbi:glutathione S-transferase [Rhodobacter veldkampii DSM 11550]|uniref:Glutathione S-transferase n=1 Tax=Phaeovulum veldkampii DSM 11550 TaxID=1185920 RepID=A0A2T4JKV3_9RHOB|nr:glutathione S-transferase [Phaeovulum veldkampii]MBK5947359.1 glutathione S-transferase [Phaeovulum veldkampii DSM 11550]PTE18539.1 glutathione S-transferase [Phaeovulum veldkampii DSM 11550]TDQ59176.1 glutathione S-transferase [Phaeovulum veldkampii DSM 11550]